MIQILAVPELKNRFGSKKLLESKFNAYNFLMNQFFDTEKNDWHID